MAWHDRESKIIGFDMPISAVYKNGKEKGKVSTSDAPHEVYPFIT